LERPTVEWDARLFRAIVEIHNNVAVQANREALAPNSTSLAPDLSWCRFETGYREEIHHETGIFIHYG